MGQIIKLIISAIIKIDNLLFIKKRPINFIGRFFYVKGGVGGSSGKRPSSSMGSS